MGMEFFERMFGRKIYFKLSFCVIFRFLVFILHIDGTHCQSIPRVGVNTGLAFFEF